MTSRCLLKRQGREIVQFIFTSKKPQYSVSLKVDIIFCCYNAFFAVIYEAVGDPGQYLLIAVGDSNNCLPVAVVDSILCILIDVGVSAVWWVTLVSV
jgi:hypothetical protein